MPCELTKDRNLKLNRMKQVTKKVKGIIEFADFHFGDYQFVYQIRCDEPMHCNGYITLEYEAEEPETLKEWLEHSDTSKKELVKWLNKNYDRR